MSLSDIYLALLTKTSISLSQIESRFLDTLKSIEWTRNNGDKSEPVIHVKSLSHSSLKITLPVTGWSQVPSKVSVAVTCVSLVNLLEVWHVQLTLLRIDTWSKNSKRKKVDETCLFEVTPHVTLDSFKHFSGPKFKTIRNYYT